MSLRRFLALVSAMFVYDVVDADFRPTPGGVAVDAGRRLPNVDDDFTGGAPDLGALEADRPDPVYGLLL